MSTVNETQDRSVRSVFGLLWLVIACFCPSGVRGDGQLHIDPAGENHTQPAHQGFALFCKGAGGDGEYEHFKWIGPKGQEFASDGNIRTVSPGPSLILSFERPTPEDSGKYTCTAMYGNTEKVSAIVRLTFFHDITWEDCPLKQHLIIGQDTTIRCNVEGNPVPTITWQKDDKPVREEPRYEVLGYGLAVKRAKLEDRGKYQVYAMVTATGKYQRRNITVDVYTVPQINEFRPEHSIIEGETGTLHCSANGHPPPLYYWTDARNRNLSLVQDFHVDPERGVLEIAKVREDEGGQYTCHAVNPAGKDMKHTMVEIVVKPHITQFENKTIDNGQDVQLECRARGRPPPDMSIRKETSNLALTNDDPNVFISKVQENLETVLRVSFRGAQRDRDGLYYCAAENKAIKVERVGHITVQYPPEMTAKENPVKTWDHNPARLECIAEAIPNATIEWWYRNQLLDPNRISGFVIDGTVSRSVLTIHPENVDRFGVYECRAKNNLGQRSLPITLDQARRPGPVPPPFVERRTPTTVTFVFRDAVDNGGMPITSYVIKWWREGENEDFAQFRDFVEFVERPITVDKLQPYTRYFFRFAAVNPVGEGPASNPPTVVETTREQPPDRPVIQTLTNQSMFPHQMDVQWQMPLDNGSPIKYFRVYYYKMNRHGPEEWRKASQGRTIHVDKWGTPPTVELRGLQSNSYYRVEIDAYNDLGYSEKAYYGFKTAEGGNDDIWAEDYGPNVAFSLNVIIAIAALFLCVLLVFVDVVCYFRYRCGLLYCLRHSLCAPAPPPGHVKENPTTHDDAKARMPLKDVPPGFTKENIP